MPARGGGHGVHRVGGDPRCPGEPRSTSSLAVAGATTRPHCDVNCALANPTVSIVLVGTPSPIRLPHWWRWPALAMWWSGAAGGTSGASIPADREVRRRGVVRQPRRRHVRHAQQHLRAFRLDRSMPVPAERDCRAEFPRLAALRRWVYPPDVDTTGRYDLGAWRCAAASPIGCLSWRRSRTCSISGTTSSTSAPGAGPRRDRQSPGLAQRRRHRHRGVRLQVRHERRRRHRLPHARNVHEPHVDARALAELDLPALVTAGEVDFDIPGDSPLVRAPACRVWTRFFHYTSGSVAVSFPALTTSATRLSISGPGVRSVSLPALARANDLYINDTSMTVPPTLSASLQVASLWVHGNRQLPQCPAECSLPVSSADRHRRQPRLRGPVPCGRLRTIPLSKSPYSRASSRGAGSVRHGKP